jgi:hypothetical protein
MKKSSFDQMWTVFKLNDGHYGFAGKRGNEANRYEDWEDADPWRHLKLETASSHL